MAEKKKKRTILMSEDPSEENWQPGPGKRLMRHLREKVRVRTSGIRYSPTKTDSFKAGSVRGRQPPRGTRARQARAGGGRMFGLMYRKKF